MWNKTTAIATVILAICALVGTYETTVSLRDTAKLNASAIEFFKRHSDELRPLIRVEHEPDPEYVEETEGWDLPFGTPDRYVKDIRIYNDGTNVKRISIWVKTYVMILYSSNGTGKFDPGGLFVPVKGFYSCLQQTGKTRGLILAGRTSDYQRKIFLDINAYRGKYGEDLLIFGDPFDVITVEYEDRDGVVHKEKYEGEMEFDSLKKKHEIIFEASEQVFSDGAIGRDDWNVDKLITDYSQKVKEKAVEIIKARKAQKH